MRRTVSFVLAGWFALTMTLAQSCAAPGPGVAPYTTTIAPNTAPLGSTASPSGGASATATGGAYESAHIDTSGYTADPSSSAGLTEYLKHRRLPLVGAQVLKSPEGERVVVLYGFVGSDFGKQDAMAKAHTYLADSSVPIDNRIKVQPELLAAGNGGGAPGASSGDTTGTSADSQYPGISSYEQQQQQSQASQYAQQQSTGSTISAVAPLLMLGLMALSMTSGGAFAVGPGSFGSYGGSPFGPSPYNPYPGFPSPSPYGGGIAPFGGVGSPYGGAVTPFGGAGSPYTAAPGSPFGP